MRNLLIIFCSFFYLTGITQPAFRTVIPSKPIAEGEVFTIQYVWEDAEKVSNFRIGPFEGVKLINGPVSYRGTLPSKDGVKQVQNFVFTVLALQKGKFKVPKATGTWNGISVQSTDVSLMVVSVKEALLYSKKEDLHSGSFLNKDEDPARKINENLFLKVNVDRKETYVGQPVVATYKLYSRLESRSDIIKNPGFYGFSVYDMINLEDKLKTIETINGRSFDVHIIRQVQLYPMQAGKLLIDPMEIHNQIKFSKDPADTKTDQEIAEGMLGNPGEMAGNNDYENQISSDPILINVKPLPEKNKSLNFNGAVGNFEVSVKVKKEELAQNEEGVLEIVVKGKGNFIQLSAPEIKWPQAIEGFEARVVDSLDKTHSPLQGKRIFRYPFVSANSGSYLIPSVEFDFFDIDSGRFRTIKTATVQIKVNRKTKKPDPGTLLVSPEKGNKVAWWWFFLPILFVLFVLSWKQRQRGETKKNMAVNKQKSVEEFLAPARECQEEKGMNFYLALRACTWNYFHNRLGLDGSGMNKEELGIKLREKNIKPLIIMEVLDILNNCEEMAFTNAETAIPRSSVLEKARITLQKIDETIYSAYL